MNIDPLSVLLTLIIVLLLVIAFTLRRIMNILRHMNGGEPYKEDLNKLELKKFRMK